MTQRRKGDSSSKKNKKSKGYVQLKDEEKELGGWEGFIETLSKTQVSQLSALLKIKLMLIWEVILTRRKKQKYQRLYQKLNLVNVMKNPKVTKRKRKKLKQRKTKNLNLMIWLKWNLKVTLVRECHNCSHVKEKTAPLTGPLWGLH